MLAKNSLAFSRQGYELLDKKRNILVREIMGLIDTAKDIQAQIDQTFCEAYAALETANIDMGIHRVEQVSFAVPKEEGVTVKSRSVMGVEIPLTDCAKGSDEPPYGLMSTTPTLDLAYQKFNRVKELTIRLAAIENAAYRLALNIRKTQKRANALKNIMIPKYENLTKDIMNVLEEKEREEFTRLKVIKQQREAK